MTSSSSDRRGFRRSGTSDHGIVSARVRPGHRVAVIDVSAGGALIEISQQRLLPGSVVELYIETAHRRATLRGRVLRCTVIRLHSSSMSYRAAIAFDRQWLWFLADRWTEYPVPAAEARPASIERVDATLDVV